jgi:hypothetical protein
MRERTLTFALAMLQGQAHYAKLGGLMLETIIRPAALVRQGSLKLYSTSLKVSDLKRPHFYTISKLDPADAGPGYQRLLNEGRAKSERAVEQFATKKWEDEQREDEGRDVEAYKAKAIALFDDDPIARTMFLLMLDGVKGAALQSLTGVSGAEYDSCRREIRRRIEALQ